MYPQIIGGGIPVGSLVMIMEDNEAPHHMFLLRYFMAQSLVHSQPLFFASPLPSPQAFLATLPAIASVRESRSRSIGPKDSSGQVSSSLLIPLQMDIARTCRILQIRSRTGSLHVLPYFLFCGRSLYIIP